LRAPGDCSLMFSSATRRSASGVPSGFASPYSSWKSIAWSVALRAGAAGAATCVASSPAVRSDGRMSLTCVVMGPAPTTPLVAGPHPSGSMGWGSRAFAMRSTRRLALAASPGSGATAAANRVALAASAAPASRKREDSRCALALSVVTSP
jgi:hypothetical protein